MSQISANLGDSQRGDAPVRTEPDSFSAFVFDAIAASPDGQTKLAHRWGIPEQCMRGYRDGISTPSFGRVMIMHFTDEELLRVTRMVSRGRFRVGPMIIVHMPSPGPADGNRDGPASSMAPDAYRTLAIEVVERAGQLLKEVNQAVRDGIIDAAESARINAKIDQAMRELERLRPTNFFQRIIRRIRGG